MKAVEINKFGGAEVLEIVDVQKPVIGKGQVLVKVYGSSINPIDEKVMGGMIPTLPFPFRPGTDFSGVITEIAKGVEGFSVGNKVYGSAIALAGNSGAFAEIAAVNAGMMALMPTNMDFPQAAALPLAGVSALQALVEHLNIQSDQKILIHGGAGGIGSFAIQLAKHMGAEVATTATGEELDFVKKLGADMVVDYANEDFPHLLKDYDAVFDTVGGDTYEKSFAVLKKGGIIVSMVAQDAKKLADQFGVTAITQQTVVTTQRLQKLAELVERGVIKPYIDKIFTIDTIKEAFEQKKNSQVLGKIVIQVNA